MRLYILRAPVNIIANEEVADVFWISIHDLNDEQFKGTIDHTFQNTPRKFPAITIPGVPVPIWGISWFINQVLRIKLSNMIILSLLLNAVSLLHLVIRFRTLSLLHFDQSFHHLHPVEKKPWMFSLQCCYIR